MNVLLAIFGAILGAAIISLGIIAVVKYFKGKI